MDATEQLVLDSKVSAGVLGNANGEFILFWLDEALDKTAMTAATDRGFGYCGTLGVVDGRAVVEPATQPKAARALLLASLEFARTVAEHLHPALKGDAAAWLESLYQLPDTREARHV